MQAYRGNFKNIKQKESGLNGWIMHAYDLVVVNPLNNNNIDYHFPMHVSLKRRVNAKDAECKF